MLYVCTVLFVNLIFRVLEIDCGGPADVQTTVRSNLRILVTLLCRKAAVCILLVNSQRRLHEFLRLKKNHVIPHELHERLVQHGVDDSSPQALAIIIHHS